MRNLCLIIIISAILVTSCNPFTDVFEKNIAVPEQGWEPGFKPKIDFTVSDTASRYNIYVVVRHTDEYEYNNLWMNISTKAPGDSVDRKQQIDLRLAEDSKGWLGSGMDDIFEHRIRITKDPVLLSKAGTYEFSLENIMRNPPLLHVMNVGIRVERSN